MKSSLKEFLYFLYQAIRYKSKRVFVMARTKYIKNLNRDEEYGVLLKKVG